MKLREPDQRIIDRALEAVAKETLLPARILDWIPEPDIPGRRPDAVIEITGPAGPQKFAVEIKKHVDRFETLNQLRAYWPRQVPQPLLIVTPYITAQIAERCREAEICFADTAGNIYIRAPGLHIYVTGRRKPLDLQTDFEGRAVTPAGLRIVFALLCKPPLLNATYREIAAAARVALGTVGPVIRDLENRRHVTPTPAEGNTMRRRFIDAERLFEEWVTVYPTTLRPKLNVRRFRAPSTDWNKNVNLHDYDAFWGGEVAANKLMHYLQPQTTVIYVREVPTRLIADHRLRADVNGDTEVLDVFWNPEKLPAIRDIVPPILAYADLFTTTDGRDVEAARMIYDEYIRPTFRNQV